MVSVEERPGCTRIQMADIDKNVLAGLSEAERRKLNLLLGVEHLGNVQCNKLVGHGSPALNRFAYESVRDEIAAIIGQAELTRVLENAYER